MACALIWEVGWASDTSLSAENHLTLDSCYLEKKGTTAGPRTQLLRPRAPSGSDQAGRVYNAALATTQTPHP